MQKTKVNWKKEVMPYIKKRLEDFKVLGIIPNLKTMFYALVLSNVIPNTQYHYQYLSTFMFNAKMNGELSLGSFTEERRRAENLGDEYLTAKEYIDKIAYYIKRQSNGKCFSTIEKYPFKSNHYVEIWLEKYSLYNTFKSLLKDSDARVIIPSKKFSGLDNFVDENLGRLRIYDSIDKHKNIYIRYFGDFDAYYHQSIETINKKFQCYNSVIDFKTVAITTEQVEKFHLPINPNPWKLTRRFSCNEKKYEVIGKYESMFQIELESLLAYAPEMFKKLLIKSTNNDNFSDCRTLLGIS